METGRRRIAQTPSWRCRVEGQTRAERDGNVVEPNSPPNHQKVEGQTRAERDGNFASSRCSLASSRSGGRSDSRRARWKLSSQLSLSFPLVMWKVRLAPSAMET